MKAILIIFIVSSALIAWGNDPEGTGAATAHNPRVANASNTKPSKALLTHLATRLCSSMAGSEHSCLQNLRNLNYTSSLTDTDKTHVVANHAVDRAVDKTVEAVEKVAKGDYINPTCRKKITRFKNCKREYKRVAIQRLKITDADLKKQSDIHYNRMVPMMLQMLSIDGPKN